MRPDASEFRLADARRRFFDTGSLPDGLVPAPILRSWQRCAEQGLDTMRVPAAAPLTRNELRERQQRNDFLRLVSRPEIAALSAEARQTDSVVIVTDAEGLVLDAVGSVEFADQASRVALRPGVLWSEGSTGTNAIGTALVERRPINVFGGEHFFEPHGMLSCAAAPIFDPRCQLAGVLDMSGHASVQHVHALGLVRLAVEQIEHRLFSHGFEGCTVLRFHRDAELLGTAREGILVFEEGRLVAANRRGLKLVDLDPSAFDHRTIEDIFERVPVGEGALLSHGGESFVSRAAHPEVRQLVPVTLPGARTIAPVLGRATQDALARAIRLADADIPLLIQGETGTGKEVFARQLHAGSARRDKPFIAVNCAALPESLIESELFGHEAGAFTGARRGGHKGLVQQAHGGVLFLDEIGDMPLALQSRLLRVLQDRAVTPLGGQPESVDFLPVCATHQPLKALVDAGRFRADLYFRIAQYTVPLAPLRDMPDPEGIITGLWSHLAGLRPLPRPVLRALADYAWPGNFRELVGTLRAMLALAEPGRALTLADVPETIRNAPALPGELAAEGPVSLDAMTEQAMRDALDAHGGNVSRAARTLGVDRSTLYRRLLWKQQRH